MPGLPLRLGRCLAKLARRVNLPRRARQRGCLAVGIWSFHGFDPSPVSPRLMKTPRRATLSPKGARAETRAFRRPHSFIVHFIANGETPGAALKGGATS